MTKQLFLNGKSKALHYVEASGIYQSDVRVKSLQPKSFSESVIPLRQKDLLVCEMLFLVDYMGGQHVGSAHPEFTNMVSKEPPISVGEIIFGNYWTGRGFKQMWQSDEKRVTELEDLGLQLSNDDKLDPFAEAFSTAKFCLLLDKHG